MTEMDSINTTRLTRFCSCFSRQVHFPACSLLHSVLACETTTLQPRPSLLIINASPPLRHLFTLPICAYTPAHMSTLFLLRAHMYSVTVTSLVLLLPYIYHIILYPTLTGSFPSCGICFSFLQLISSHQNFTRVRNPYCGRHCTTVSARLFLC